SDFYKNLRFRICSGVLFLAQCPTVAMDRAIRGAQQVAIRMRPSLPEWIASSGRKTAETTWA
ncbi:hypothetical protein, partial [Rhodovulum sulfidophilum]|uniref:hypothetical protein n=1 Tax=Rhodovulum sulfidophilum TaxID=35806 RepID=UPI001F3EDB58